MKFVHIINLKGKIFTLTLLTVVYSTLLNIHLFCPSVQLLTVHPSSTYDFHLEEED